MLDIKPNVCQLSTHQTNLENFNRTFLPFSTFPLSSSPIFQGHKTICSTNSHLQSKYSNIGRKYPDIPKSFQLLDKKRPNLIFEEQSKSIESIFKDTSKNSNQLKRKKNKEIINSIRHIGSQTIYRDESTQTDPFSPAYTISDGEHPEVFALSDFTYGKGLPASSIEISFIERLRARREWEQDHTIDMTRTKIVIEREIRDWQIREQEIKRLQETQHKLFTKNLHNFIDIDEDVTQKIIDLSKYQQEKQLEFQHKRLDIETSREIRRIKRIYQLRETQINAVTNYKHLGVIGIPKRGNGCISSLKPPWHTRPDDIITTFKNSTLKMSIPCSHFDDFIDRRFKQAQIDIFKFEELLPKNAFIVKIDESDRLIINQKNKSYRRLKDLEKAHQLIQKEKTKHLSTSEDKPLRFVEKIETIDHIKESQTMPIQTETHDRRRNAIIKLQNYLRSIIVQSKISNVREIRQDLLDELRIGLSSSDTIDDNYRNELVSPRSQIYDYVEGAIMSDMFDFLSKELLRLQCEQTIHLFILLADRYRSQREAKETGSRTKTNEQQILEDQIYQQMFSLSLNTDIDHYLQDLILESISNIADEQARVEIQQITETLINRTDQINNSSCNIEEYVSDLVHNFLIPTVQKILNEKKRPFNEIIT